MCGISGIITFTEQGKTFIPLIHHALLTLNKRGPDAQNVYKTAKIALGHTRLSIIDTSTASDQPFMDQSGRYVLVFNGEIFNYKVLAQKHLNGVALRTTGDTEVLLQLLIKHGIDCLKELHGFFAFCFYDLHCGTAIIARDRYGKKPLVYYTDTDKFIFGSEIKSIEAFKPSLSIDKNTVYQYFKYNYNPSNFSTIYNEIHKLAPGHYCKIGEGHSQIEQKSWYEITKPNPKSTLTLTYQESQKRLISLLEDSVQERMISDVSLGAFLSGGIDSSVVVALASKHVHKLETFSIGFKDNPFFDETAYAELVAQKYRTKHHKIILENKDLLAHVFDVLAYIDEPFADSSALAVYVLSHETRKHVKVALSGDGADEIFAGYNKYWANIKIENANVLTKQLVHFKNLIKLLPASRSGSVSNKIRQVQKFIEGLSLDPYQRFIRFCAINTEEELEKLFHDDFKNKLVYTELENIEKELCHQESKIVNTNDVLWRDQQMVLPNDMLVKIDLMSMANSLEVRSPFLDHRVGEFANSLPENYKIDTQMKKKIVQDAFREILPEQLYNRPKKGFDVPLMDWFKNELHSYIFEELLEESFVREQKIFDYQYIIKLKQRLFSNNPQDAQAQIWALVVFQYWYKKRFK